MLKFTKNQKFSEVTLATPLKSLESFFNTNSSAVVTEIVENEMRVKHVVTKIDLLSYLVKKN